MSIPPSRTANVISSVRETLDVICKARDIEFESLDEAMIDKLLWSSFNEYLGSGGLVADATCMKRS